MNYEFIRIKCSKKDEKRIEKKLKKGQFMAVCFLNGLLFPITVPYQIYKKIKGGKRE